jgi:uncharacterized membrane protein
VADYVLDLAALGVRWLHLIAGIAWIGASFYFVWLDNHLEASPEEGVAGELWSVHGGGFYSNRKFTLAPPRMPKTLHWFKWEAYWTWISGFALLVLVYYVHPGAYLVNPASSIQDWEAVTLSVVLLALAVVVYDVVCRSPLGRYGWLLAGLALAASMGIERALQEVFSGRGAYIQVGAMIGTIMVANVLMVIIPGQRRMVDAVAAERTPDPADGLRGKQRSVHNNYLTLPVLLVMISNHYPVLYGRQRAWLVLGVLFAAGMLIRHFVTLRQRGRIVLAPAVAATLLLLGLAIALRPHTASGGTATLEQVRPIIEQRCSPCHAGAAAPAGIALTDDAAITAHQADIRRVVASGAMPLGNTTQMTQDERDLVVAWASG